MGAEGAAHGAWSLPPGGSAAAQKPTRGRREITAACAAGRGEGGGERDGVSAGRCRGGGQRGATRRDGDELQPLFSLLWT